MRSERGATAHQSVEGKKLTNRWNCALYMRTRVHVEIPLGTQWGMKLSVNNYNDLKTDRVVPSTENNWEYIIANI